MAIGLAKEFTKVSVMEEVTEGTPVDPAADTDYVQPLDGGFSINGAKELKERNILTTGFGKARPRVGLKSVEFQLNLEAKGSGTEGEKPEADLLLKNLLGDSRQITTTETSSTGHTASVINFADTSSFTVGDIVVVKESGAHHVSPIITVTTNTSIELLVAADSAFSDGVVVSKCTTYFGSNTQSDFKSLTVTGYWGDEIKEQAEGVRPSSFALTNFTTGELASFEFSGEGLSAERTDGSAPHTPNFDDVTPPLILSACLYENGTQFSLNDFTLSVNQATGFITSTCDPDGRISSRKIGKREITGTINPYLDDTSVARWTKFDGNVAFSLFAFMANPSTTAGELEMGSVVGFYMPNVTINTNVVAELDGVLTEEIEYTADAGAGGDESDIFIGVI